MPITRRIVTYQDNQIALRSGSLKSALEVEHRQPRIELLPDSIRFVRTNEQGSYEF